MRPLLDMRPRHRHRPCLISFCDNDSSDRYNVPLCQEHVLAIWIMVDEDMRSQNLTAAEVARADAEREEEERRARLKAQPGTIYYLQLGEYLKIGYTTNLERRIREYPPNATLLGHHSGTREDEQNLHQRFACFRDAGREWYRDAPEIREHIDQFKTGYLPRRKRRSDPPGPKPRSRTRRQGMTVL